ncbi:glycosyltransferase [Rhodococcoides corynebacterioides]|uniref:glycosyltransferase n=1 Tax=Rhodococcoides corynebacterioides TaxID=53972 RepID=UPI001C9B39BF|nr:glycosyltransferase family 2 protein [Rhodococcus corynebacterioides]MBY6364776.1 glycosyltransferase family 2 protein [Rhodococcus corynebacterioides]
MNDTGARPPLTLSVVVPAFDEGEAIETCLARLAAQELPLDRIIVVDNGSRDDTVARIERFAAQSPVPVDVLSEPTKGTVHARTRGYDAVTSDLIGRIDVDTHVEPDWSARIVDFFTRHGETYSAASGFCVAYDLPFQGRFARAQHAMSESLQTTLDAGGDIDNERLFGSNMAVTRAAWRDVRGSLRDSTAKFEDLDLSLTLSERGHRIALIPYLQASISGRRFLTPVRHYVRYALREMTTYDDHGLTEQKRSAWIRLATVTMPFYAAMWIPFRAYDPERTSFSARRLARSVIGARRLGWT